MTSRSSFQDVLELVQGRASRSARPRIAEFVASLGRMQPRMYSIASSQAKHPGEAHLTVGLPRYDLNDRSYQGAGSSFLGKHLRPGRALSVFVQRSHGFRLPADPAAPVILVGPGTGVVPFRAFLQQREAAGQTGRNWLFFGNQRRTSTSSIATSWKISPPAACSRAWTSHSRATRPTRCTSSTG